MLLALLTSLALLPAGEAGAQTADRSYMALGDSYSSGTGTREYYDDGVDCERSVFAYSHLLAPQLPGSFDLIACGGARTQHITTTTQKAGAPPQANWLGPNTDYVSISIGGNDAGFSSVLLECGKPFVSCQGDIDDGRDYINNTLPARLDTVYARIRERAPNARVNIVGYPRIFNGTDCNAGTFFSSGEMSQLNELADLMAQRTRERAQAAGFSFTDARQAYLGHAVCDSVEWLNGLSDPTGESYHPNRLGHVGYAGITRATLLAAPAPDQVVGPNGRIAFSSDRDGNNEIYAINGNGTFPVNLSNDPATDLDPQWSPDGTKILFTSNRDGSASDVGHGTGEDRGFEIYVMDADGGNVTRLTSNNVLDRDPTWSPNGEQIAFRRQLAGGNNEIFRMTATGGLQTNLTSHSGSDFAPAWSPDGSEIAFQRCCNNEVMRMNADGQGQVSLSNHSANDGRPAWHPNGNAIAFHSNRDGNFEIYTMTRSGSSQTRRTNNSADERNPGYSPNGASLAFQSDRDGGDLEVYTSSATGGSQTRRTSSPGPDTFPSWQGDGTPPTTTITSGPDGPTNLEAPSFAFTSNEPGSTFRCRVDGGSFSPCGSPYTTPTLSEGPHSFEVRAIDPSGNVDQAGASRSFEVDTSPAGTAISSGPSGLTNESAPSFEFGAADSGVTFECRVDDEPFEPCSSPHTTADLADGEHSFSVLGTTAAGTPDPEPVTVTFTVDTIAPGTALDFAPPAFGNDPRPSFEFSSDEVGSTFECRLGPVGDSPAWEECTSPQQYGAALPDGEHAFEVRAIDPAGNQDPDGAAVEFAIDTLAPATTFDSTPTDPSEPTARFEFSAAEDGVDFECRLDSGDDADWQGCSSPHVTAELTEGEHSFEVRGTDRAGNVGGPATHGFHVDTTAPDTTIVSDPGPLTNQRRPTFEFTSDDDEPTYECRIVDGSAGDDDGWEACDQLFTPNAPLDDGEHSFQVRAIDPYLNVDDSPATRTFVVDATAPETTITAHPGPVTNETRPRFGFEANEPGAFECRLDGAGWSDCEPGAAVAELSNGEHTFEVRATDAADNVDPDPPSWRFTVDTVPPKVAIESGPPPLTGDPDPSFSFSAPEEAAAAFECRIDGRAWRACSSPHTAAELEDGDRRFLVRGTDEAGNTGLEATHEFTVDTAPPQTRIDSGPSDPTATTRPRFAFSASEAGSRFRCSIDEEPFTVCSSPYTSAELEPGRHSFAVVATDEVGNSDPTPAATAFTIAGPEAVPPGGVPCEENVERGGRGDDILRGGAPNDALYGLGGADSLIGRGGGDCLYGGGGGDWLQGGPGHDRLRGGPGADVLQGGSRGDLLVGGRGRDLLVGGSGRDVLKGGRGPDVLRARDGGEDVVNCGAGRDRAIGDREDTFRRCEVIRYPSESKNGRDEGRGKGGGR